MLGNIKALAPYADHYWGETGAYFNRIKFENGYGASIVSHQHSYGGHEGLFEVAVIDAKTEELVYDTPITSDVMGHLTFAEVAEILEKIKSLPPAFNPWVDHLNQNMCEVVAH
jgi:hypothetical protein